VPEVPVLGTGKLDYVAISRMAAEAAAERKPVAPAAVDKTAEKSAMRTAFDAITRRAAE
jgi:hypothetical protein